MVAFDAIVLAGGRSSRMGGVDKVGIVLAGRSLLAHACEAVAGAATLVVVGPDGLTGTPERAVVVREDPPFGGPAAALGAGLNGLPDPAAFVVVVAGDVPRASNAVPLLLAAAETAVDGVLARQGDGRRQPLLAVYRSASLRAAVDANAPLTGLAVHRLISGLELVELELPDEVLADIDTPADLRRHEEHHDN